MGIRLVIAGTLEDHAVLKYSLASVAADAEVEVGSDGYRAVELARRIHATVVIVDPMVPGLSGPELVAKLRETVPEAAVICWTAQADVEEAVELLRAGACAYLLKEDGPTEVVRHIPSLLEGGLVIAPSVAAGVAERFTHSIQREGQLAKALAETTMQLQEVANTKEKFVANVNHELRTPVTIVKGIAHLLKSGQLSPEDEDQFVQRMDQAVDRLTGLVEQIIQVAELEQGTLEFDPEYIDFSSVVEERCDAIEENYPEVTLRRQIPAGLFLMADPQRIGEAVSQLLDNACRFSPPEALIAVETRLAAEGVVFSVMDAGEGLRRDIALLAFKEPFVTGEDILRKERAGLGIGLHLARKLILLHGGIMWTDPLPSGGTRVSFCIPQTSPLPGTGAPSRVAAPEPMAVTREDPAPAAPEVYPPTEVYPAAPPPAPGDPVRLLRED
jgi:signal transduction histidine kinase